jgi:hypothetical protein
VAQGVGPEFKPQYCYIYLIGYCELKSPSSTYAHLYSMKINPGAQEGRYCVNRHITGGSLEWHLCVLCISRHFVFIALML